MIGDPGHKIQLVVHPVDEKNVNVPALGVRYLVPRRAPPAVTVCRFVDLAEIRLGLDDHSGNAPAGGVGNNKQLTKQIAGDSERVLPREKFAIESHSRQFLWNTCCTIPGSQENNRIKCAESVRRIVFECIKTAVEVSICL